MTSHGYYHPSLGYWQAFSISPEPSEAAYPAGTVKVPVRPGQNYVFDPGSLTWIRIDPQKTP